MKWLGGIIDSMDMSLHKLRETVRDGGLAYCSSWGHKEVDTTEHLDKRLLYLSLHRKVLNSLT